MRRGRPRPRPRSASPRARPARRAVRRSSRSRARARRADRPSTRAAAPAAVEDVREAVAHRGDGRVVRRDVQQRRGSLAGRPMITHDQAISAATSEEAPARRSRSPRAVTRSTTRSARRKSSPPIASISSAATSAGDSSGATPASRSSQRSASTTSSRSMTAHDRRFGVRQRLGRHVRRQQLLDGLLLQSLAREQVAVGDAQRRTAVGPALLEALEQVLAEARVAAQRAAAARPRDGQSLGAQRAEDRRPRRRSRARRRASRSPRRARRW